MLSFTGFCFWPLLTLFQGDLNKKEKNNQKLEQQIKNMVNGCDKVSLKQKEDITCLEEEIQKITAIIQVSTWPVTVGVNF